MFSTKGLCHGANKKDYNGIKQKNKQTNKQNKTKQNKQTKKSVVNNGDNIVPSIS
jgi:hypothetical protein